MNNNQERAGYSNEISLVDLAATFIRRRRIFYASFVLVTLAGIAYALMKPGKYEYVTLLESAEKTGGEFIEKPAATVAAIQAHWVPEAVSRYQARHDKKLPFKFQSNSPDNTGLIRIVSESSVENAELLKNTHQALVDNVIQRQQQLIELQKKSLKNQIASIEQVIQSLQSSEASESTGTALAAAIQKRAELESELEALQPARALVIARQSIDQKGASGLFIVALTAALGGMLGVFLAFFAEFAAKVRQSLTETTQD
ncbi:MAG: Wzz/FepE/Etk N-terminal domain-containing protein [Pseudomonadota bacterium]|nr:Wzz/FepE/Etk N-terminal domain-containing protein [Pseudomonadota bacterium]